MVKKLLAKLAGHKGNPPAMKKAPPTKKSVAKPAPALAKKKTAPAPAPKKAAPKKPEPPKKDLKKTPPVKAAAPVAPAKGKTPVAVAAAPAKTAPVAAKGKTPVAAPTKKVDVAPAPAPAAKGKKAASGADGEKVKKVSKKSSGRGYDLDACREIACESSSTTAGYCRLHYIKNWRKIKRKEMILREKKLNQYIEELVSKYPDKYLESIRMDLADEKAFGKVIHDLELDESLDDVEGDEDSDDAIVEGIRRDFEDDGDF